MHYIALVAKGKISSNSADVAALVGARVKALRSARGWTLDQIAGTSGISRRAIINMEQGSSNVGISTLLRVAEAFGVSLAELVQAEASTVKLIHDQQQGRLMWSSENGGSAVLLASTPGPNVVEIWEWVLAPGDLYEAEKHSAGTRELVHVSSGLLALSVGSERTTLRRGGALWFEGEAPHSYANIGAKDCRFSLTVYQPGVGV